MEKSNSQVQTMRDATHDDFLVRWITYMKTHPNWREKHAAFINAQYQQSRRVIQELAKTPEGKAKIRALYDITNKTAYKKLLG